MSILEQKYQKKKVVPRELNPKEEVDLVSWTIRVYCCKADVEETELEKSSNVVSVLGLVLESSTS